MINQTYKNVGFEIRGETVDDLNGTVCDYHVIAKYVDNKDIEDVLGELKIKDPEVLRKLPKRIEDAVVFKVRSKCCDYECETTRYLGIIRNGEHYLLKIRGNYELYHNEDDLGIRHFIDRLNGIKVLFENGLYDSGEVVLHDLISMLKDVQVYPLEKPKGTKVKPLTAVVYEFERPTNWTYHIAPNRGFEIVKCIGGDSGYDIHGRLVCAENAKYVLVKKCTCSYEKSRYALYSVNTKTVWCDSWDPDCAIVDYVKFKFKLVKVFDHEPSDDEINALIQQT
jgi:hypothetical protein